MQTPIKNQAQCGGCWAFSATETTESVWKLAGNSLIELAPQQIIDCDTAMQGCNGGWPCNALQYVVKNGMETESAYPFVGRDTECTCKSSLAPLAATRPPLCPAVR